MMKKAVSQAKAAHIWKPKSPVNEQSLPGSPEL